MFRWLVPRHQAEVAATTWKKKTAAATARQKRRRNVASELVHRPQRTEAQEERTITMYGTCRRPTDSYLLMQGAKVTEHRNTLPVLGLVPGIAEAPLRKKIGRYFFVPQLTA